MSSKQALQYGLVDQVISVEGFRESVQAFAEKISEGSLAVIQEYLRISKGLVEGLSPEELVQMESLVAPRYGNQRNTTKLWNPFCLKSDG